MKTTYKNLTITGKFIKNGLRESWNDKLVRPQYKITVKDDLGKRITFDFTASHDDYKRGVYTLQEYGLLNAFYCFVSDSLTGSLSYEDFASEFGIGYHTYKECVKSFIKLEKLNIEQDIYDFINELQEIAG